MTRAFKILPKPSNTERIKYDTTIGEIQSLTENKYVLIKANETNRLKEDMVVLIKETENVVYH